MRLVSVFASVLLAGCVAGPTMHELESRAMLTGNWADVEKRERSLARRQAQLGPQCPSGYVSYCEVRFGERRCECLERDDIYMTLGRF